jgi:predicted nuclease of restriction endonuclease-like RecB superfamily
LTALFLISSAAGADVRKATIHEMGQNNQAPLFRQQIETTPNSDGSIQWVSTIKDLKDATIMTETASFKDGRLISQYVEQFQTNKVYELKVDGKEATFTTYKLDGKKRGPKIEKNTVSIDDDFITGPTTESYLAKHWSELVAGKTVYSEFGILEVGKAIGFRFKKVSADEHVITLMMRPSGFFISFFVDPIYIDLDMTTKKMVHFKGRTPLRKELNGKMKPWDGEVIYSDFRGVQ